MLVGIPEMRTISIPTTKCHIVGNFDRVSRKKAAHQGRLFGRFSGAETLATACSDKRSCDEAADEAADERGLPSSCWI
jgi:hypothetical protein